MPRNPPIPEDFEKGKPSRNQTGNYLVNNMKTLLFWDGRTWHIAVKDFQGDYTWHKEMLRQPDVKYYKLIQYICT